MENQPTVSLRQHLAIIAFNKAHQRETSMLRNSTMVQAIPENRRGLKGLSILLVLILGLILFAGLQPYTNYEQNWVSFTPETNETHFGEYGLVIGDLPTFVEQAAKKNQLQILITPIINKPTDNKFHVFAQIDTPGSAIPLIFGQWNTSLIAINGHDRRGKLELPRISANLSRHVGVPTEVLFTFGQDETKVELDGRFEASAPAFQFSDPFTRISIGNSPDGKFGWYGRLASVKLIDSGKSAQSITYRFDENNLPLVQAESNTPSSKPFELTAPKPGGFPDKAWIGSLQLKQLLDNNLTDVVVNFLGFTPFGFLLTALLSAIAKHQQRMLPVIATLVLGFLLSFGIESLQTMIPGRSPHMHDLFLNTSGTLFGSIAFLLTAAIWAFLTKPKVPPDQSEGVASIKIHPSEHIDL